jgi:hypothetical protein
MQNFIHKLNWLRCISSALVVALLPLTIAPAALADLASSTITVAPQPVLTIALRTKQRKKPKAKKTAKRVRSAQTTATAPSSPPTPATEVTQVPPPPPAAPTPAPSIAPTTPTVTPQPPTVPSPAATPDPTPGTKLFGEAIFGIAGATSGDYSRTTTAGYRLRLELRSSFTGKDLLTTRLQTINQGLPNSQVGGTTIPEGALGWTDGTTNGAVKIDALNYQFPLTPQTIVVLDANAGQANDFTDTVNPLLDGDGGSGSISAYGTRAPIYYTVQGTGAGLRHKLNDRTEVSLGYLARNPSNPASGNGLFNGSFGAIAQITFQPSESSKLAATYVRAYNSDSGTGSINANLGGSSNNFGIQGFYQLNPQFALGGWVGYTQNQLAGNDRQIWNWAVTAAAPDFGSKGNLAGILVGQEPRVTADGNNGTADTTAGLHIEGFYQIKINDNFSITPGIIFLTAPNQDINSRSTTIGVLRSTFTF